MIDSRKMLYVLEKDTRFSADRFSEDETISKIWKTLIKCWVTTYTCLPNRIFIYQSSSLGQFFVLVAYLLGGNVKQTRIESHHNLGIFEQYHEPLCQTYGKILLEYRQAELSFALAVSFKTLNHTPEPEEIFLLRLQDSGSFPFHTGNPSRGHKDLLLTNVQRLSHYQGKISEIMTSMRKNKKLKDGVPRASKQGYRTGNKVLFWREILVNWKTG